MHILLSWIGHTDLRAMAVEQSPEIQKTIGDVTGMAGPLQGGMGPVRTLVEAVAFERIYLLSNYAQDLTRLFLGWLGQAAEVRYPVLSNPTDYGAIFAAVDQEMRAITHALVGKPYELSILLSPGTPAMAAIWVLLGKTKYPARFYQTYGGKAWVTDIPFDLTVDVVPELLQGIANPVTIPIRPITLLFGKNSTGKSTLLQALHYLREVLEHRRPDPNRTHIGGDAIDLGGFQTLVHAASLILQRNTPNSAPLG